MMSSFYFILLLLSLLSYIYEITLQPCKKKYVPLYIKLIRFIHHLLPVLQFLLIFKYPLITIILSIIIKIHWVINNDKCELTVRVNEYCGYDTNNFLTIRDNIQKYECFYRPILVMVGYYITNKKTEYISLIFIYLIVSRVYKNKYKLK